MSFIDTPIDDISLVSSDIPPGRSLTVTVNLSIRPRTAKPRSKQRPNIVESILPPQSNKTTLKLIKTH